MKIKDIIGNIFFGYMREECIKRKNCFTFISAKSWSYFHVVLENDSLKK